MQPVSPSFTSRPRWRGIGIVVPYDFVLDAELWSWAREDVALHLTRTPHLDAVVGIDMVKEISDLAVVEAASRDLSAAMPQVTAYACTSGSFVRGLAGEARLCDALRRGGAPLALTTSGALLDALDALGVSTVSVATPYDETLTKLLEAFLAEAGHETVGVANLGLRERIADVDADGVMNLARAAARDDADALFLSCTNLCTIDVIARLEALLDRPVLSANLVTMWASLRAISALPTDRPERLFQQAATTAGAGAGAVRRAGGLPGPAPA
ncbi:MAG: maleate cis-trans isomerase family protein [Egibacteraceae bacterium]